MINSYLPINFFISFQLLQIKVIRFKFIRMQRCPPSSEAACPPQQPATEAGKLLRRTGRPSGIGLAVLVFWLALAGAAGAGARTNGARDAPWANFYKE